MLLYGENGKVQNILFLTYFGWGLVCIFLASNLDVPLNWLRHFLYDYFFVPEGWLDFMLSIERSIDSYFWISWFVIFIGGALYGFYSKPSKE